MLTELTDTPSVPPVLGSESEVSVDPIKRMKVVLACPTYGPVDPVCTKMLRVSIMNAASRGVHWDGDASPDRVGYSTARNQVAQVAVENEHLDGIVWVDSDILLRPESITRLLLTARHNNLEFLSGVYHQRQPPYLPVIYKKNELPDAGNTFVHCLDYPKNVIVNIEGCGFGFVYTSRKTIVSIANHPSFDIQLGWFPDTRDQRDGLGEDLAFCLKARAAGITLFIDTGIQVGHCTDPYAVTEKDFRENKHTHGDLVKPRKMWGAAKI